MTRYETLKTKPKRCPPRRRDRTRSENSDQQAQSLRV